MLQDLKYRILKMMEQQNVLKARALEEIKYIKIHESKR